MFIQTGSV